VVDNGSTNDEGSIINKKYPEIFLIKISENKGFGEANNVGIRLALERGAGFVLLLNNDTTVSSDFLYNLVDYAQKHEDVAAVGPKILYYNSDKIWFNGGKVLWWIGFSYHLERLIRNNKSKINNPLEVDYITGCCVLFKKEILEKVGLLDATYLFSYEDVDWGFRARKLGYKNVVVPSSVIWHKVSAALGEKGTQKIGRFSAFYYARNGLVFARKNLSGLKKFWYMFSQFTFRLAFNLLLCVDNQARRRYLQGLVSGLNK